MNEINTITVPCSLCTLNEYINAERNNKYIANNIKQKNTNICMVYALEQRQNIHIDKDKLHDLEVTWYVTNNRSDCDNVYFAIKFLLDGMVKANIIKSDGRKHIRHIAHKIFTAQDNKIVVKLIEI